MNIRLWCALLSICLLAVPTFGQRIEERLIGTPVAGIGLESIMLGVSTLNDVALAYGEDYERIEHRRYSIEYEYKRLGLAFYACAADPDQQIFNIEITFPFAATTPEGAVLGVSTREDLKLLEGIAFEYDGEQVLKLIDIFESDGLRQCDFKFGVLPVNDEQ